jgi:hypothetical protein
MAKNAKLSIDLVVWDFLDVFFGIWFYGNFE